MYSISLQVLGADCEHACPQDVLVAGRHVYVVYRGEDGGGEGEAAVVRYKLRTEGGSTVNTTPAHSDQE